MRLVTSGVVVLLAVAGASCGKPASPGGGVYSSKHPVVSVYSYQSADRKVHRFHEPFAQLATWTGDEWIWKPVAEDAFTDSPLEGTLGAWRHDGSIDEAIAGVYVAGERVSGLESLADFDRMKAIVPPLRWSGSMQGATRVGTWLGFGPSGSLEWLVESEDPRGLEGADVRERRWPSGRMRLRGRYRLSDAIDHWVAWDEDGNEIYRGWPGGPNELPEIEGRRRLTVQEVLEWGFVSPP